jgi:hypothetical protein
MTSPFSPTLRPGLETETVERNSSGGEFAPEPTGEMRSGFGGCLLGPAMDARFVVIVDGGREEERKMG